MKKMTQLFLLIPVMAIMGCSAYEFAQKTSYENQPLLQIPPGLSSAKMQNIYPIPGVPEGEIDKESVSLLPPGNRSNEYKRKRSKWLPLND